MPAARLGANPLSKGGKDLWKYKPNLARPSRNFIQRPCNKSLNITDRTFPSGMLYYGCCILVFELLLQNVVCSSNDCFIDLGQINQYQVIF